MTSIAEGISSGRTIGVACVGLGLMLSGCFASESVGASRDAGRDGIDAGRDLGRRDAGRPGRLDAGLAEDEDAGEITPCECAFDADCEALGCRERVCVECACLTRMDTCACPPGEVCSRSGGCVAPPATYSTPGAPCAPASLVFALRTDYAADEVGSVEVVVDDVELASVGGFDGGDDFLEGVPLGSACGLEPGEHEVEVTVLDDLGCELGSARLRVDVDGEHGLTLVVTRRSGP